MKGKIPTTNISQRVKRVSDQDCQILETEGIKLEDDIRYVHFEDPPKGIPVVKRRNLNIISQYLILGYVLNRTMDMHSIQTKVIQGQASGNPSVVGKRGPDMNRVAPKIHTNPLPDFSGDTVDYEERERKYGAIIKQ